MARTKKTKRIENSDGSSFRVQISELSDQSPDTAGTQGGPSAESSEEGAKVAPSHFTVNLASQQTTPEEEEGSGPSRRGEESDSSNSESDSSSSSRLSINSEERHSRLHEARLSHAAKKGDDWSEPSASHRELNTPYYCHVPKGHIKAMKERIDSFVLDHVMGPNFQVFVPDAEDAVTWPARASYGDACFGSEAMDHISASKKAVALMRTSIMQQKRTSSESLAKETPIAGTSKPSSSQQPDSKVRKMTAGSTSGSARKQSADKQPITPQSVGKPSQALRDSRPPRGGHQEPDLVEMAKSMIKAIPLEERDAVKGVGTLDLDGIMGLLSEIMRQAAEEDEAVDSSSEEEEEVALQPIEVDAHNAPAPEGESSKDGALKNQAPDAKLDQAAVETQTPPNV
ncbi:uncharacterized protein LOC110697456 [Chenopodium quinoa]|uniref:uncharacterized protein LOC110697456 n=1 Tax=Chenopodium quinoa TaxID=63459 RepID=UPI000B770B03|nr:uncharacterized protein LOC110697456 [Chenopodium quinoa]